MNFKDPSNNQRRRRELKNNLPTWTNITYETVAVSLYRPWSYEGGLRRKDETYSGKNGDTSDEDCEFDYYNKTDGQLVYMGIDQELKTATPVTVMGIDLTVPRDIADGFEMSNYSSEMKTTTPASQEKTITKVHIPNPDVPTE